MLKQLALLSLVARAAHAQRCTDDPDYSDNNWYCADWAGYQCSLGWPPVNTPERTARLLESCPVACLDGTPSCIPASPPNPASPPSVPPPPSSPEVLLSPSSPPSPLSPPRLSPPVTGSGVYALSILNDFRAEHCSTRTHIARVRRCVAWPCVTLCDLVCASVS